MSLVNIYTTRKGLTSFMDTPMNFMALIVIIMAFGGVVYSCSSGYEKYKKESK